MPTKKEVTNRRPSILSSWNRQNLPDSSFPFLVYDIDWILVNVNHRRVMVLEEKVNGASTSRPFETVIRKMVAEALEMWCDENEWQFDGFNTIKFNGHTIDEGITFNDVPISEQQLKEKLSLGAWMPRVPTMAEEWL